MSNMMHIAWFSFISGGAFIMALDTFVNRDKKKGMLLGLLSIVAALWAVLGPIV